MPADVGELERLVGFWRAQFAVDRAELDATLDTAEHHRRLSEGGGVDADHHAARFRATRKLLDVMRSQLGQTAVAYASALEDFEVRGFDSEEAE